MESMMTKARRVNVVSICLLGLALTMASAASLAKERDRDDRRGQRDHRASSQSDVQRSNRKSERDQHHKKSTKQGYCFECRVDKRQFRQHKRIRDGWVNGDLTRHEHKKLKKQQFRIERMERRFGADGKFTQAERKRLVRALDRSSDRVYRLKHNDRYQRSHRYAHDYGKNHRWRGW
jgi:hypothetical protein